MMLIIVKNTLVILEVFYLIMSPYFFRAWLRIINQTFTFTSKEKYLYLLFILIATIFWPVVIPFAYLELVSKPKMSDIDELQNDWQQDFNH
jgi:uncharacterized membrane protein (DUF106 family)